MDWFMYIKLYIVLWCMAYFWHDWEKGTYSFNGKFKNRLYKEIGKGTWILFTIHTICYILGV